MTTEAELLRRYASERSEEAFAELVRRNVDLVYSAALRQLGGDAHAAHDVSQMVFTALARKSGSLTHHTSLVGWLYTSTHYATAKHRRSEQRRRQREQEAHIMHELMTNDAAAADWQRVSFALDAAMLELAEVDREAVLLRFFEGKSFVDVGLALRLSDEAARKRVDRALEKLCTTLAGRGITSTSAALALALGHNAVAAAPAGTAASLTALALSGAATGGLAYSLTATKLGAMATALLAVALITVVGVQHRAIEQLRLETDQLAAREQKLSATQLATASRLAALQASATTSKPIAPPKTSGVIRSAASVTQRAALDNTYRALFRSLKLKPQDLDKLKDLLLSRQNLANMAALAMTQGGTLVLNPEALEELRAAVYAQTDAPLRALLGETGFERFAEFEQTRRWRPLYDKLEAQLEFTDPLRDDQIDQLARWNYQSSLREAGQSETEKAHEADLFLEQAAAILSPLQWEKLKAAQDSVRARKEMQAINTAAAKKGLLTLSRFSQRYYPSKADTEKTGAP